jgi:hypothetical protein
VIKIQSHYYCESDKNATPIDGLMEAISECVSIKSLIIEDCYFYTIKPLIDLLQRKNLSKFHYKYCFIARSNSNWGYNKTEVQQFFSALTKQKNLKDLLLDYGEHLPQKGLIEQTLLELLPQLEIVHLCISKLGKLSSFCYHNLIPVCLANSINSVWNLFKTPHNIRQLFVHHSPRDQTANEQLAKTLDGVKIIFCS